MVAPPRRRGIGFVVERCDEPVRGVPRHFPHGLVNRRQLRPCGTRHFRIIEARDRHVGRDGKAKIAGSGDRGGRHVVILGQNGGRTRVAAKQIERDPVANLIGEVAGDDELVINGAGCFLKGLTIAFGSSPAGSVRRIAEDDADAAVPKREDVRGDRFACGDLVHRDDHAPLQFAVRRDPGVGELVPLEHVEQGRLIAGRGRQNDTVEAGAQKKLAKLFRAARDMVERQDDEPVPAVLEPAEGAVLQLNNITWTRPFIGQADQETAAGDQALRGQIGVIVERRRSRFDLFANGIADMRGIV